MPEKNYYKILQIDPSADPEVVQAAYRRLAQKYHPDANTSSDATRWMQELNEAYEVICDPVKRAAFDRQRADRKRRRAEDQRQAEHERQQKAQATEQKRRQEEAQRS
ncbi:partial Chaperone protein DnaJ, partial [Anaerolineae bacterium]